MFLINKKTGLLVTGVRMLHSHSVDEGAFDREGRLLTFKIDVHDEEGTLIGYTDSEGTTAKQRTRSLSVHLRNIGPTGKVAEPVHATREAFRMTARRLSPAVRLSGARRGGRIFDDDTYSLPLACIDSSQVGSHS